MQFDIYNDNYIDQENVVIKYICDLCDEINFRYNENDIRNNFGTLVKNGTLVNFIAVKDCFIVGVLGFYVMKEIFNNDIIRASEAYWYVKPQFRGCGLNLLDYAEMQFMSGVIIELGIHNKKLLRVLQKKGYIPRKTIIEKVI